MSDLPEGWEIKTVGQLFDIQLGKMLNKKAKNTFPQYPYLGNSNVRWGSFELSELKTMHFSEKEMTKFALQRGDILLCEGGEVGRCAIWQEENTNIFYQKALHRLRGKSDIISEYFQLYMQFINGSKLLDDFTSKTSIAHLTREKLTELPVKTPPLPEQRKIAQILSTWDKAIATTEKQIANSKQQKKALMQQLLTGKKRLAGFSGDWERYSLKELTDIDKQSLGKNTPKDFRFEYISLSDVDVGTINKNLEWHVFSTAPSRARRIVKENDILLSTVRPNLKGFACVKTEHSKCVASTGFTVLTPKKNISNDYIYQYLFSAHITGQINSLVVGSNYPAINSADVAGLKIYCPCYEEQQKIAQALTTADKDISTLETQLTHLQQEKKALMQQLLTGKRRVVNITNNM